MPLLFFSRGYACTLDDSNCENSIKGRLEIRYDEHTDKNHSFIYLNDKPFVKVETNINDVLQRNIKYS